MSERRYRIPRYQVGDKRDPAKEKVDIEVGDARSQISFKPAMPRPVYVPPCTAWNGHRFQKFDDAHIYCPTCGATKTVQ